MARSVESRQISFQCDLLKHLRHKYVPWIRNAHSALLLIVEEFMMILEKIQNVLACMVRHIRQLVIKEGDKNWRGGEGALTKGLLSAKRRIRWFFGRVTWHFTPSSDATKKRSGMYDLATTKTRQ